MSYQKMRSQCLIIKNAQCYTWIRHPSISDDLGEQDAEGPDVGLDGKPVVVGGLGCRPLDGEAGSNSSLVLILLGTHAMGMLA